MTREELQRISIDSVQDWKAMKQSYRTAAHSRLDELLATSDDVGAHERDLMLRHLNQVRSCSLGLLLVWLNDRLVGPVM